LKTQSLEYYHLTSPREGRKIERERERDNLLLETAYSVFCDYRDIIHQEYMVKGVQKSTP